MAVTTRGKDIGPPVQYYIGYDNGPTTNVDLHTFVQTDPEARGIYEKLLATGLWQYQDADEYAMKTAGSLKSFYDKNEFGGQGININPNTGGPESDAEKAAREKKEANEASQRAEIRKRKQAELEEKLDWRVRLHLAESADYLYKASSKTDRGILDPLHATKGIIFPYTPTIGIQYNANYANYDLVHSNYRGYFYTGSSVPTVLVTADFTANDLYEANYLLASLHFLRSCTKMFYGNDAQRGMPPPVVFLTGYGEYQFKNHPCVIQMVNYNLPNDVDYIPAGRTEDEVITENYSETAKEVNAVGKDARLASAGILPGGSKKKSTAQTNVADNNAVKIYEGLTYVPTKITINFTMLPIQTRKQVSKDFSLAKYGSGELLKKGIW